MNPIARLERACARAVEGTFARVFPSDLEPAQVGRKLIAAMQAAPGDRYLVRVNPSDFARLDPERDLLEARWSALMAQSVARESRPRAFLHEDPAVVAGAVVIEAVADELVPRPLLVRADGVRIALRDGLRIGRARDNDVVLDDRRVSRYHARIDPAGGGAWTIVDLHSSNGTFADGRRVETAELVPGLTLTLGQTVLRVAADAV